MSAPSGLRARTKAGRGRERRPGAETGARRDADPARARQKKIKAKREKKKEAANNNIKIRGRFESAAGAPPRARRTVTRAVTRLPYRHAPAVPSRVAPSRVVNDREKGGREGQGGREGVA